MAIALNEDDIRTFAADWYRALDRHVPLAELLPLLTEDLVFAVPEDTFRGHEGFTRWYDAVTNRFFDEVHTVTKVDPVIEGGKSVVQVLVNWQAKIWDPPAAASRWLGFDADQTWTVVPGPSGLQVAAYTVNALNPMPGSPEL